MITPNSIIVAFWAIFIIYWLVSAIGVKKNIRNDGWGRDAGIRILVIILIVVLLQESSYWTFFAYHLSFGAQVIGVVFCAFGMGFAIWARRHLGKNWSGTPSMKVDHELVTSGPYRLVRHPIYTGMLLALVGSALTGGIIWLAVLLGYSVNFLYRIPLEERYMIQLFPDQYPEYRKRTKALIPFVW